MSLRYLSVCSGMEAASVAWEPLGWSPVAFSEIEPFPSAILKHRFPKTPNYGNLLEYKSWPIEPGSIDLLVGGTPCQSFSVAGLRKGLDDPRGNLALVFLGLVDRLQPEWVVWENVPGVLSSNGGRDFGSFLGALVKLGYGFAYRILDSQFVGRCRMHRVGRGWDAVPQRRRRVFVIACRGIGGWERSAKVLFNPSSLSWDSKKGRKKREALAANAQGITPKDLPKNLMFKIRGGVSENTGKQGGKLGQSAGKGYLGAEDKCFTISTSPDQWLATAPECLPITVRRLTPRETERLQGFPDDWSKIPWKGKPDDQCPDGPRYKACGNSMAVPVMRWIGEQISKVERDNK